MPTHLRRLAELDDRDGFAGRHVGTSPADQGDMLAAWGHTSLDQLLDAALPGAIRTGRPLTLPPPVGEAAVLEELRALAARNRPLTSLIGMGYSGTFTPPVIQRNVLENPAWYTAYTPYQPEISQGRLEALLNFQTVVADLTGLPVANASLLDEATAAAEALTMCRRLTRTGQVFLVDAACHPQTIEVVATRAAALDLTVAVGDPSTDLADADAFGVLVQYPGTDGEIPDLAGVAEVAHRSGALVVAAADLLATCLLVPPGELGADIAVGSAQRFGVPLWYGGPHAAYMATRSDHSRSLPGRLVGVSVDAEGRPALRLSLQTREQHIRRERATSNICTAQALLATVAGLYAAWHGPEGLRAMAERVHRLTAVLAEGLRRGGHEVVTGAFFDTLTVRPADGRAAAVAQAARDRGVNLRPVDEATLGVSLDETTTPEVVATVWEAFGVTGLEVATLDHTAPDGVPPASVRTSEYLAHPVFHRHRSETAMLRYLRALADKDLALDRSMIPLGSCTMKLNAAVELTPVTWPGFTGIHPFAPLDQAEGYLAMIADLERWLAELSGYDAVSLQPNAGSQGEFAGLLAIRAYHQDRGQGHRRVCLIPVSAHGTNAASAIMAGLRVVPVACDEAGNVALDDLEAKVATHGDDLAAIMLTYPSTHGVYEEAVQQVCATVHQAGGQVYIDGANLNALVGVVRLAEIGGDVSHFNLHKTFCIPHGGGGPGVGPIGVKAHLASFLPGSRTQPEARPSASGGAVSEAPFGSPGVLPVTWAYLRLMGAEGLTAATGGAVLAANYLAHRLADHYPVLYTGRGGYVAHECILDLRPTTHRTGITAEDVAKRLIDAGFHAPTMSFPVPGTLMVEPTESEPKAELDRFCEAMIAIRGEIAAVEEGLVAAEDTPLRHAPHTVAAISGDTWDRPYSRAQGAWLTTKGGEHPYWAPVARIDNAHGDRHLVCTCPPLEELAQP
ncbi:MAG TPA: aminomethyl-transferring glycine dehydrogenase [Acidimicrobiales bacterium]|jgi:glycine dehydrogenase|nr:aminomethyl-transferring glycine dehydrogenase [Acidimicrobiales bacterium]